MLIRNVYIIKPSQFEYIVNCQKHGRSFAPGFLRYAAEPYGDNYGLSH